MPVIGFRSNILATRTVRLLDQTARSQAQAQTQLSSGLRINRAADDPGSLAVSMKLSNSSRVSARARLNISDGISALQIADGTLGAASNIVLRMTEIAQQAANGAFSSSQRSALQLELSQLKSELLRISDTTTFNGRKLFAGGPSEGQLSTVDSGATVSSAFGSSDGRYVTVHDGSKIFQIDRETGVKTTITASGASAVDVTSRGDYVAYEKSGSIYLYDRLNGTTSTLASGIGLFQDLAISDDGTKVAFVSENKYVPSGEIIPAPDGTGHLAVINTATGEILGDGNAVYDLAAITALQFNSSGTKILLAGKDSNGSGLPTAFVFGMSSSSVVEMYNTGATYTIGTAFFGPGDSIVFDSSEDIEGLNPTGRRNLFSYKDGTGFANLTNFTTSGFKGTFFVTNGGNTINFVASHNVVGENSQLKSQLFRTDGLGNFSQVTKYSDDTLESMTSTTLFLSSDGNTGYIVESGGLKARDLSTSLNLAIETGNGTTGLINGSIRSITSAIRGLSFLDTSTQRLARLSLDTLNLNIQGIAAARSLLGSGLARLETASQVTSARTNELRAASEKLTATDVAETSSRLLRNSILQDVQVSLLAQASKLVPETALSLITSL